MAEIHDGGAVGLEQLKASLPTMADEELIGQQLVQQGAVHAISYLLTNGCNEDTASQMLASLRANAQLLRDEANRRGKPELFERDQTVFN